MSYSVSMAKSFLDAKARFRGSPAYELITAKVEDFFQNPDDPRFRFEKMHATKFAWWKFRIDINLRVIVARIDGELILCYVDQHDDAYDWAQRRKYSVNDRTGEIQVTEFREDLQTYVRRVEKDPPLFENWDDDYLLRLGMPEEYLPSLRAISDEKNLWKLFDVLPEEVAVRLDDLQKGLPVPCPVPAESASEAIGSQLCFARIDSEYELRQALESPMEKWIIFLHPTQEKIAKTSFDGPARVSGSAGTGKSVVALHRAFNLAKTGSEGRVLLTTLTTTMAEEFNHKLSLLVRQDKELRDRIVASNIHHIARSEMSRLNHDVKKQVDNDSHVRDLIEQCAARLGKKDNQIAFLVSEWEAVIDPWGIKTWEEYEKASRAGRGTPLQARQKVAVWEVFEEILRLLAEQEVVTHNQLLQEAADLLLSSNHAPYEHVVADETQDLSPTALRLLRALVKPGPNDLFMCRDAGQSIYSCQYALKDVGIDVSGRSKRLRRNYRTTREIQAFAERLLPAAVADGDGSTERREAVSILTGPEPVIQLCSNPDEEIDYVANHLKSLIRKGAQPNEIAIFARRSALKERVDPAVSKAGLSWHYLKDGLLPSMNRVSLSTMHNARGLEYRIVVVMGCDFDLLPHAYILDNQYDDLDKENFVEKERHALYVACTRARENLLVTCSGQPSIFLKPFCPD